ncbi:MAG: FAD-dependent oxidoreductase [Halanaerobiaceae bacterium]|jgi:2,4-dienoyl-CoA reductase-like NADH-dependent reductase (Old Yellow Enzyme family)/thioredoxin reductase|nr:FAD-dependent oxidoreductase [Halanaerobiaceae bacterium]
MSYDLLFTPFKIRNMLVKNRLVMAPMGTFTPNSDGSASKDTISYYERRARGGVGMIILGAQFLNKELAQGGISGILEEKHVIPQLTELCESIQRYGAKAVCQISPGTGRNSMPGAEGEPPMSASAIPSQFDPDILCRPMTLEDIQKVIEGFERSATIAKNAGFDAIEIHGHAGYLIDQFMSEVWNKRDDEYGGSPENRARLPREIIRAIRRAVGDDMPVFFRIALDHRFEGGRTIEESIALIKLLEEEGVDTLDIDVGAYESIDYIFPPAYLGDACMEYVCEPARRSVKIPIMNAGNHTPETAVNLIKSGNADFVMFGRPLIADPDLPRKLMEGRAREIRPCIRCNQDCIGRIMRRLTKLSCSVNPAAGFEDRFSLKSTESPERVVVIGAGPAGLEAARTAALAGHKVDVYDKEEKVGGQLAVAATPDFKRPLRELVEWYENEMDRLEVNVRKGVEIKPEDKLLENYDRIIVATGALPDTPSIPGIDGPNVISIIDAHRNKKLIKGEDVVICGGGLSGCDSALELATEEGKNVTIVEMTDEVARDELFINRFSLLRKLEEAGVKIYTKCKIIGINKQGVEVEKEDGSTWLVPADTVVISLGMKENKEIAERIMEKYPEKTRLVGDCVQIGRIGTAIRMGFFAGSSIE